MKIYLPILIFTLFLTIGFLSVISCDDDDDDDSSSNDPATDDDSTTDDDDSGSDDICVNNTPIDPLPNPGMTPDSDCTSCHNGTDALAGHAGVYDGGAPGTCMSADCHACP